MPTTSARACPASSARAASTAPSASCSAPRTCAPSRPRPPGPRASRRSPGWARGGGAPAVRRIEDSDRATDEDRRAAAAARAVAEEQGRAIAAAGAGATTPSCSTRPTDGPPPPPPSIAARSPSARRSRARAETLPGGVATWHPTRGRSWRRGSRRQRSETGPRRTGSGIAPRTTTHRRAPAQGRRRAPESIAPTVPAVWSPKGDRLAVGGRVEIAVYDAKLVPLFRLRTAETAVALAFSADGARLFAGLEGGGLARLDVATGATERELAAIAAPCI